MCSLVDSLINTKWITIFAVVMAEESAMLMIISLEQRSVQVRVTWGIQIYFSWGTPATVVSDKYA